MYLGTLKKILSSLQDADSDTAKGEAERKLPPLFFICLLKFNYLSLPQ